MQFYRLLGLLATGDYIVFIFFCRTIVTFEVPCKHIVEQKGLPANWPCEWNNGTIPYAYNFYVLNPQRLINVVQRGITHIERRSCLKFVEHNPIRLANNTNVTYLFFTFSDVLEYCCLPLASYYRQRVVLITPLCTIPVQVAHAILHALGLTHVKRQPFPKEKAEKVLNCINKRHE